jgi:PKD repeat protein
MQLHNRQVIWNCLILFLILAGPIYYDLDNSESSLEKQAIQNENIPMAKSSSNILNPVQIGNEAVNFENASTTSNLSGFRSDSFAWGDYNNDGYLDFITRGNTSVGTRLFKNNGPPFWNFSDVSVEVNIIDNFSNPNPIWGDYNNDGFLDFFMAGNPDSLWQNNGPPSWNFTDVTLSAGNLDDGRPSEAAGWGDYNRDGYIDLYVNSWYQDTTYFQDVLWHNDGDGTFTDVSSSSGINIITTPAYRSPPFAGMAVSWGDFNNDGWLDIYVGKYHVTPNSLFRNNHDGTFTDVALVQGVAGNAQYYGGFGPAYSHTAGAGWADFNNNGNLDLWISNLAHKDSEQFGGQGRGYFCDDSMMFRNQGGPFFEFEDIRNRTGIPITPVGAIQDSQWKDEDYFGVTWGDYDNDCDLDFWVPQVKTYHSWAHSYLWRNNNNETFTDASDSAGIKVWSNTGGAWGDYNNDGFLDLITEGTYQYQGVRETRLFKNKGNSNNWLQIRLKGVVSNTAAIGARVFLKTGEIIQMREIGGDAGGHAFQNSFTVEFGLGVNSQADEVKILWPSGIVQVLKNIEANQILSITENTTGPKINSATVSKYQAIEDEVLTFSASISNSVSLLQWDYDNDGNIDSESSGCFPPTIFSFSRAGNYTAKVWVWDVAQELGWTETTDFIVIDNVAPTAIAGIDKSVWEDQLITFEANSSTDTTSDSTSLEFNWSFGDGSYSGWNRSSVGTHNYSFENTYEVILRVRDDDHAINIDTIVVTVKNRLPSIEIISETLTYEDKPIIFNAIGDDTSSDLPFLLYRWDFGDGNDTYWSTETTIEHVYTNSGTYTVRCMARDDDWPEGENFTEVEITVYNVDPECVVEFESTVDEDETVYFSAIGNDTVSDRAGLFYLWDFADGTNSDWLEDGYQNISHVYTQKGVYHAKLIVKDDNHAQCIKILDLTVNNLPPSCSINEMGEDKLEISEDDIVSFTGSGSDTKSDLSTLVYSWDFGVPGIPGKPWNSTAEIGYRYRNEGDFKAVLTVMDDDGDTANASVRIIVSNIFPTPRFLMSESQIFEDEIVEFDASASEDSISDMDTLNFTWDFGDDTAFAFGSYQRHKYTGENEYRVKLTVRDDNDYSQSINQKIKVKNIPPSAELRVSATKAVVGLAIKFNSHGSWDSASDIDDLLYSWDFGDDENGFGKLVTHTYDAEGEYIVVLTVIDDDGSEATAEVEITISTLIVESKKEDNNDFLLLGAISNIILIIILVILLLIFLRKKHFINFGFGKEKKQDIENAEDTQEIKDTDNPSKSEPVEIQDTINKAPQDKS